MFNEKERDFISTKMSIDISSIEEKINSSGLLENKSLLITIIKEFISIIDLYISRGGVLESEDWTENEATTGINVYAESKSSSITSKAVLEVLDTLRHSFSCFSSGGLHLLYTRQENELWYPKVVIKSELQPNDICSLPLEIKVYRGCNTAELESGTLGQSWTTSIKIAEIFAFQHYAHCDWFDKTKRMVVEATCYRGDVLFSDQTSEHEIIVDPMKLIDVKIHTTYK